MAEVLGYAVKQTDGYDVSEDHKWYDTNSFTYRVFMVNIIEVFHTNTHSVCMVLYKTSMPKLIIYAGPA